MAIMEVFSDFQTYIEEDQDNREVFMCIFVASYECSVRVNIKHASAVLLLLRDTVKLQQVEDS